MKRIYKYTLESEYHPITLPKGSTLLSAQAQNGIICIWAIVDVDEEETETVYIATYGTGESIDVDTEKLSFIGTTQLGAFVFHVFKHNV